jgi:ferredoxin
MTSPVDTTATDVPGRADAASTVGLPPGGRAQIHRLRIVPVERTVDAPADRPLLASALAAGVALRSSCRNGTCRACLCRMRSGSVVYRIEWPGLSPDEKEDGFVLPCVAYPTSDVTLEAPACR